jgi:hypothetical protein
MGLAGIMEFMGVMRTIGMYWENQYYIISRNDSDGVKYCVFLA